MNQRGCGVKGRWGAVNPQFLCNNPSHLYVVPLLNILLCSKPRRRGTLICRSTMKKTQKNAIGNRPWQIRETRKRIAG